MLLFNILDTSKQYSSCIHSRSCIFIKGFSTFAIVMKYKEVTIYDIAEKLNIAASTVSRGLKGHYTVSLKTQKLINSTAEAMGFRFNTFAANLRRQRTDTIGVILPKFNSNFMAEVIAGIEKVTNNAGLNLIVSQSLENLDKEARNVKTMLNNRVDGLLVSLTEMTTDITHFDIFFQKGIPVLFFDRVPMNSLLPSVTINNLEAGYIITKHLLQTDAKKIVHVSGNQSSNVYRDRFLGYKKALDEFGIEYDASLLIINSLSEEAGIIAAKEIIQLKGDAVFVTNDTCASSCMNELKRNGIRVPEEIRVAGFNNDIISRNVEPALTTINYPGFKMGEIVASKLVDHLYDNININEISSVILEPELLIRPSTIRIVK